MHTARWTFSFLGLFAMAASPVATGCGGSVFGSASPGDAGPDSRREDAPPPDARHEDGHVSDAHPGDAHVGDGGCVANPTLGGACTGDEQACQVSDPCCIGYVWQCSATTHTWTQEQLGCACVSDAGKGDAERKDSAVEVPVNHRPNDSQCAGSPPPGDCPTGIPMTTCSQDSQCTMGTNGRCIESNGGALFCSCTYDTCAQDTDCPTGQLCACHGGPYAQNSGNTCMPGNCRVDSDCGANGYCSPSGGGGCGGLLGYYCHTSSDQCVNDSDCSGQGLDICEWSSTDNRWECQQQLLCG